jgi:hypothetical protein
VDTTQTAVPAKAIEPPPYEGCDQCGAPVEAAQRYCVVCGTRRKHVADPAARFMSAATSRTRAQARTSSAASGAGGPVRRRRPPGIGTALVIALIPVGIGLGVVVGHSNNNSDAALLAALRAQKPETINVGAGAATPGATPAAVAAATVTTSFPLSHGYAVQLSTLPAGSSQGAAQAAEAAARVKGATQVGIVGQSGYSITPSPGAGAFVVYSGAFSTRAQADHALARLKPKFPTAVVISVSSSSATATAAPGKVLSSTRYGSAQQVAGFKATSSGLAAGGQVVNKIAKTIGKSYVGSQTGLPSQISVP